MHDNDFDEYVSGRIHEGREELADFVTLLMILAVVLGGGLIVAAMVM